MPELEPDPILQALAATSSEPAPARAAAEAPRTPSAVELEEADRAAALDAGLPRRRSWLWAVAAASAIGLLLGGLALSRARPPSTGRVVLDVSPPEARGRVRLTVGGADLGVPTHFPVVQAVPVGKVEILASADGFKPALIEANVAAGEGATSVLVPLQHAATVARFTVLPEPDDAEVRLDGQVVKRSGLRGLYVGELIPGAEHTVQVRRAGYRPTEKQVRARSAEEAVELPVALEPLEFPLLVTSAPPGAVVFSGERLLGVTPLVTKVTAAAAALTLRKRCFETAQVPLHLPEQPGPRVPVRATLRKVPGCR